MIKVTYKVGLFLLVMKFISDWIITPIISVKITDPTLITIFICFVIVFMAVILPFVMKE